MPDSDPTGQGRLPFHGPLYLDEVEIGTEADLATALAKIRERSARAQVLFLGEEIIESPLLC